MQKNSLSEGLVKAVSSVLWLGYSPLFPGTLSSLAAFLTYILALRSYRALHFAFVLVITIFGWWFSDRAERLFKEKDARQIVIDDFNGMLIGLLFLPYNLWLGLIGFIIFRLIDIGKPYPIARIEKLAGGLGIMGDDIVAGIYTNIILQLLGKLF